MTNSSISWIILRLLNEDSALWGILRNFIVQSLFHLIQFRWFCVSEYIKSQHSSKIQYWPRVLFVAFFSIEITKNQFSEISVSELFMWRLLALTANQREAENTWSLSYVEYMFHSNSSVQISCGVNNLIAIINWSPVLSQLIVVQVSR